MNKLNKLEKKLLKDILWNAINSDDFESWTPAISNILDKLGLE